MLTLIIPVRDWPTDRLSACVESFLALKSKRLTEILIVDFGSSQPIRLKIKAGIPVRSVRLKAVTWSLAEAINAGVLLGAGPVFAKTDADILVSAAGRAGFDEAVDQIANGDLGLAVTQTVDLDHLTSLKDALAKATKGRDLQGRLRPKWGQGGLVFFSRDAWDRIGGFDSRFTGWGNEDNDFQERIRHAGIRFAWTDRSKLSIFHVWHPPSYAKTGIASHRQKNQELAKSDRSVFRSLAFRHSNALALAKPAVIASLKPIVTLAIATTGRPGRDRMLKEAINSFKGQINNDVEVFVCDNGSTDRDFAALKKSLGNVKWPARLTLERLKEGSIPKSRNVISHAARGRYICVVDDDDIALPNRLADQLRVFEKDGRLHGCHGGWIDFDESTGLIERNQGKERSLATLMRGTGKITAHPTCLYRADVMRAVPYDEAFALGSDLDLAMRMAAMGLDVAHTRSYLVLRRFHSANVTLTGLSSQVSNGLAARGRIAAMMGWNRQGAIAEMAKAVDAEVYCTNILSMDSILQLLPGYLGEWQLLVPVSAMEMAQPAPEASGKGRAAKPVRSLIEQIHSIQPGALCMRRSGANRAVYFRTLPVKGLARANALRQRIEALLDAPIDVLSLRQAELDRQQPYDWKAVAVEQGKRVLRSKPFLDCADVLVARSRLVADPALAELTAIVADWDGERELYFLLTAAIKGYDEIRRCKLKLERLCNTGFEQLGNGGMLTDVTMGGRSH